MWRISVVLAVILFGAIAGYRHCEVAESAQGDRELLVCEGLVSGTDWVGSTFLVGDKQFTVSHATEVYKGGEAIWFSDMGLGDQVTVDYYKDDSGALRATRITIEYNGDFPV